MALTEKSCDEFSKKKIDFEALSPPLQNLMDKIIEKANFTKYEVTIKDLSTCGKVFLSKLYEIDIKDVTHESEKEVNIFIKEKIILKKLKALNMEQLYSNEELIYKELSKIIIYLQHQANVPLEDRFKLAKAYDETSNDVIILENLCKRGFKIYGKSEPVSLKFVELGVQELAKLHALSFVIENKMPEFFKKKITVLQSTIHFDEDWEELMRNICGYVANLYDDENKTKIENFVPVLLEKLPRYYREKSNICTLLHGDYKKNNVMFRTNDGEPVEVVPIDYQFIDYGCPIRDLAFFIFSGTDRELRRKHLDDLKELYFETLSSFLKYFNMDVETVFPSKEFEKVYTEWLDYGLMMTLFVSVVLFAPDAGLDFENLSYKDLPFCPDKKFDDILRGLVDDFIQWGYL